MNVIKENKWQIHYGTERGDENEDQKNVRKMRREKLKNDRNDFSGCVLCT